MLPLLLLSSALAADGCAAVDLNDVVADDAPSVLVLGEHPGAPADLRRATRVVRALRDRGPVTLALEAVGADRDRALQTLRGPEPDLDAVPSTVGWSDHWPGPYAAYRPLMAEGLTDVPSGVSLVAVGITGAPTADDTVDVAAGDIERIARLAGEGLPFSMRHRLARARAWSDGEIADAALDAWSGEGTLVIVVNRIRAAQDGGVPFQLRSRTDTPVRSVILGWTDQDCGHGSLVWRPPALRATLPAWLLPDEPAPAAHEVVADKR